MKIAFYTENNQNTESVPCYGGLTADLAGLELRTIQTFPYDLEGKTFAGSYTECLQFASTEVSEQNTVKAAIVLTDDPGEENQFVKELYQIIQCPIVGGGAARNGKQPGAGFSAGKGQVFLFLITDDSVEISTEVRNIHDQIIGRCTLELIDTRTIARINGIDAVGYLKELKHSKGFSEDDFEHLTLSTLDGINAHLSLKDGKVFSGRDLDEKMILRYVDADQAYSKIEEFYQNADEETIVFGCAGLGTLLEKRFDCSCFGTFLYGEICYTGEYSDFGNLMLSKMTFRKKALRE